MTKTQVQLKTLKVPYAKEIARPEQSPKGQIPFIDDDGTRIADSYFIRAHLERKLGTAAGHANLVAYTGRMMTEFFPEHPWAP